MKQLRPHRRHRYSLKAVTLIAIAAALPVAQFAAKRPLNHRDYNSWKAIQGQALSRDGKFLAYALFPQEGDGQLVVRNLTTGAEVRENVGTPPPPRESTEAGEGPTDLTPGAGFRVAFTHDNRFAIASFYPAKANTDKAIKERKRPEEMPKNGLVVVDLAASTASRIADVASFQVPEAGESFLAYLRTAKPAAGAPASAPLGGADQAGRGGRGGAAGGARSRNQYGSDLVLRDLRVAGGKETVLADVAEYSMSKDGKTLAYAVASRQQETNGVYTVVPGSDAVPVALLKGKGHYTRITWDTAQRKAAFLSDRDDTAGKPPKFKMYLWERASAAPAEVVSVATAGFKQGYAIADRGAIRFSRDGSKLFFGTAPIADVAAAESEPAPAGGRAAALDKAVADLWNYKDDYVQPMQKVRSAQERNRTYTALYDIPAKKFLQLGDPTLQTITPTEAGPFVLGTDDRAYRTMVDYDGNYSDTYAINTATGARVALLKKQKGAGGGGGGRGGPVASPVSPDGKHLVYFREQQWHSAEVPGGKDVDLTGKLPEKFVNEDHDTPDEPNGYGMAGWTKDGKSVLLYDRYDVWLVAGDGSTMRKLTDGRANKLQFRVVRLDSPAASPEEEPGIDPAKPLLLRAESLETRETGFYSLASLGGGTPQKLLWGPKAYRTVAKAKDADVILLTATSFYDQPDLYMTDSSFKELKKVTDANPQQKDINWGTSEMIKYRNADGVELQAVLYKPEDFDPSKKYPMIVYLYERLSQNMNNFVRPAPHHSINFSYYVSNGYLILTPDIVYTKGHPGQSALKCVLPAVQTVVEKGFVNRNAIGIQGHSWGGYQIAYMLTQTGLFRAAESGAPVVNMISAYGGIRWGSGLPRQFQYEKTQSRIGGSIWDSPLLFMENSPIFMMNRVTTPVLILHNDADDAVPWYQGIEYFLSLRRLGKEAYLFNYNGEPHHLNRRPNQKDYTVRMQQFFDHYLKDAAKPAWMEKGVSYNDREKEKESFFMTVYSDPAEQK